MATILKNNIKPEGNTLKNLTATKADGTSQNVKYVKVDDKIVYDTFEKYSYSDVSINSFSYNSGSDLTANTDYTNILPTITYGQVRTEVGYSTNTYGTSSLTSGASITYGSVVPTGSTAKLNNTSTGSVTVSKLGAGSKARTKVLTVTANVTLNDKTLSKSYDIYQAANVLTGISISLSNLIKYNSTATPTVTASYTSGSKAVTATLTSSDTSVATIVNGQVKIVGIGKSTITASYTEGGVTKTNTFVVEGIKADQSAPTATGDSKVYHNTATATATGGGEQGTIEWSNGNTRTAAGTTTTKARWSGNNYYNASPWSNEVNVVITKANPVYTVNLSSSLTYNGSSLNVATSADREGGDVYLGFGSSSTSAPSSWFSANAAATATNLGTYYVWYKVTGDSNHNDVAATYKGSVNIGKKAVTITAGSTSKTYDGSALSYNNSSLSGLLSGHTYTCTVTGSITNAGTANNVPSAAKIMSGTTDVTSNYSITYTNGTLTVNKKDVTITGGSTSKTYDNTALTYNNSSLSGLISGHTYTCTVTGSITNAGSANNVPSAATIKSGTTDVTANYNIKYANGTLTVNKRKTTVTGGTTSKTYDGSALSYNSATASNLVSGHHLHSYTCTGSITNAGTANNVPSAATIYNGTHGGTESAVTSNYEISYANGTLTVDKRAVTITGGSTSKTYDASALTYNNSSQSGLVSGHTYTCTVTGSITNVGTANNVPSAATIKSGTTDVTGNYTITYKNGTLTVNKRDVTITAGSTSRAYNGSALTYNNSSQSGLVSGHTYTCTVTGSITNVGSTNNVPSAAVIKSGTTDVTGNYNVKYANGTLTISARTVTPTAPTATARTYNKSAQTIFTAGSSTAGGTMYYNTSNVAFSTSTWSTSLPYTQKTDAGTYTIYWYCYVSDTTNNTGTNINKVNSVSATIAKANQTAPTITATTVKYHETASASVSTAGTAAGTLTWTNGNSRTAVGSQDTYAYYAATSNYNQSPNSNKATMVVNKATDLSVTVSRTNKTYTGSALTFATISASHGGTAYIALGTNGTTAPTSGWTTSLNGTNAGTYYVWKKLDADTNHSANISATYDGTVTISAKGISTPSLTGASVVFHNTASLTVGAASVGTIYYRTSSDNKTWGSWTTTKPTRTDVGTTYVLIYEKAPNANYSDSATSSSVALTVTLANDDSVTVTTTERTYNRAAQVIATCTSHGGTGQIALGSNSTTAPTTGWSTSLSATNAGTYYVWKKLDVDASHTGSMAATYHGTVKINAYNISNCTLTLDATSKTYSGSSLSVTPTLKHGTATLSSSTEYSYSGNSGTNAGSYTVTCTGKGNYTGTKTIGWTMAKAANASASAANKTYNGGAQTGVTGSGVSWSGTTSATDQGTYTAYATPDANHTWSNGTSDKATITWTMSKKAVTITAGSDSKVYDGGALTKNTSSQSGLISGHTYTCTVTGTITNVGSANNVPSAAVIKNASGTAVTGNYSITYTNGKLTITARATTVTATNQSKTWDGSALSAANTATATNLVSGHTVSVTCTGSLTAAGSSTKTLSTAKIMSGTTDVSGNYSITKANGTLTVNKAATASASAANKTYSASAQTGVTGSYVSWTGTTSATDQGTYTAYATPDSNHTWSNGTTDKATITWTMSKKAVTVTASGASKTYDGSALTKNEATATGLCSGHHLHSYTCTGTITNVGSANNVPSAATIYNGTHGGTEANVTSNYSITYANGTLKVTARATTVTATNQSKTWDGTALSAANTASGTNLVSGHTVSVTCTGSQTAAGSSTKTLSTAKIMSGTNDVSANYTITKANGTLTVSKAQTATATGTTVNYTGSAISNGVSGSYVSWSGTTSATNTTAFSSSSYTAYATPDSNHTWKDTGGTEQRTITWKIADYVTSSGTDKTNYSASCTTSSASITYTNNSTVTYTASASHTETPYDNWKYGGKKSGTAKSVADGVTVSINNTTQFKISSSTGNGTLTKVGDVPLGSVSNSNYNPVANSYTASISISNNALTAKGGTLTVSASAAHNAYYYYNANSHSVTITAKNNSDTTKTATKTVTATRAAGASSTTHSLADTANVTISSNGNNRFSISGSTITHSNMTTNAVTDTVTVRCTNASSTSIYKEVSASIKNNYSDAWNNPTVSAFGYASSSFAYTGGTSAAPNTKTASLTGTRTFDTGSTTSISNSTFTWSFSTSSTGFTVNSSTGAVTAASNSGAERSGVITATATGSGSKTGTKTFTFTLAADPYNGLTIINLGLPSGHIWAANNVGSTTDTGLGKWFAYGDKVGLATVAGATYANHQANTSATIKGSGGYNSAVINTTNFDLLTNTDDPHSGANQKVLNNYVLKPADDAAHLLMGGKWRMATIDCWEELYVYGGCTWSKSGTELILCKGPNGNTIKFPKNYQIRNGSVTSYSPAIFILPHPIAYSSTTNNGKTMTGTTCQLYINVDNWQGTSSITQMWTYAYYSGAIRGVITKL